MKFHTRQFTQLALLGLMLTIGLTSCKDFLTENNKSGITQDSYYTTAEQAQAAIDGLYPTLRDFTSSTGYGESNWVGLNLLVGHAGTNGQSDRNRELIDHTAGTNHPLFDDVWTQFYNGVSNANVAIANIPDIEMDATEKKSLLGEAHFMRALFYYYLVRLYGNIPMITDAVDATSPELYPEQSSADSVYQLIVSDLKTAEESGLPNTSTSGRASLGAVKSLLASVYLTMAGEPLNKGNDYYQLAADKAEEVIDTGWYSLFDDYSYLHDREHKNQEEFIFQVQYEAGIATNNITALIIPENEGISTFGDEYGSTRPIDEFVASYDSGDKRTNEKEFYFTKYTLPDGTTKEFNEYALYKYWLDEAANPATGDQQNDENWTLLRLPEVMLIYAEASNEVNGPTPKAREQLAAIRDRADLTTPGLSTFTKDSFREAVWKERYHELCFEDKAYFDIQRTHMVYDLRNNTFVDAFSYTNIQGTQFTQKYMLWPIPDGEIQTNPNLEQNEGWK